MRELKKYNKIKLLAIFLIFTIGIIYGKNLVNLLNKRIDDIESSVITYKLEDKVYGMPYINPAWEEYMELTDEEKAQVEIVPEKYIYNYIPEENLYGNYDELPERFNLIDNYPTNVYDQGSEGLCWAYAMSSMFESNLLYTKNIKESFSAQQMSHLISYKSPYNLNISYGVGLQHTQHTGFFNSIVPSGMIPMKLDDFDDTLDDKGNIILDNIINKNKINYQIKNATLFPVYDGTEDYIKMLKSYIKKYGAVYVGITAPMGSSCYDETKNLIYYQKGNSNCEALGHAMIIVGWDDNYGTDVDNDGKVDGAWILQNSYGDYKTHPYLSYKSDIPVLYGVKEIVEKNWDNNYDMTLSPKIELDGIKIEQMKSYYDEAFSERQNNNALLQTTAVKGILEVTYHKRNLKETLQNIEFSSGSQNSDYSIYISPDGNKDNYQLVDTIKTDLPGTYSVDCNNIELNSSVFSIKIVTNNGAIYTQVSAFTKNNDDADKSVINVDMDDGIEDIDRNVYYHFYITAKNIDRNIPINVRIKYENGEILVSSIPIDLNTSSDFIVKKYEFPKLTKKGSKFNIEILYNDEIIKTLDIVYNYGLDEGSGTEEDPFVIKTKRDFEYMEKLKTAYFILNNDIDLKDEEIKTVGGIKYNIRPTEFNGKLDGNGHVIKNLYMETTKINIDTGLFKGIQNSTIKNLKIENANIKLNTIEGYPTGGIHGIIASVIENSSFENVYVSGNINGNNESSIGLFAGVGENITINNCYIVGNIKDVNGHIGSLIGTTNEGNSTISNSVIVSNISGTNLYYYETQIGGLIGILDRGETNFTNLYVLSDYDIKELDKDPKKYDTQISTLFSRSEQGSIQNYSNINIYNKYCEEHECIATENEKNNTQIISNLNNLKQQELEYFGFDSNLWEKINDNTLPTLKQFENIFISDFNMDEITIKDNEEKELTINVYPQNSSFQYYKLDIEDESIAQVEGNKLKGLKFGTTNLIITAQDGSNTVKTIKINVENGKRKVKFIYKYNNTIDSVVIEENYDIGTKITLLENDELNIKNKYLYGWEYKGKVYRTGESFEVPNEDVTFISEYRSEPPKLSTYEYSNEDNIIKNICYTSIENYINNLNLDERKYFVEVFDTNGEKVTEGNIGTGYVTKIFDINFELIDYINIVPGDLDGDGLIRARDVSFALQYLVGMRNLGDTDPSKLAMDFSRDGEIKLNDARLIHHFVARDYSFFAEVCPNEVPEN